MSTYIENLIGSHMPVYQMNIKENNLGLPIDALYITVNFKIEKVSFPYVYFVTTHENIDL